MARAAQPGQSEISLNLPAGCCWIANNLHRGDDSVAQVLPVVPEGSVLHRFSEALGWQANTYEFGAWSAPDWIMAPGEGFVLCVVSGNGITITFVGEVDGQLADLLVQIRHELLVVLARLASGFE